MKVANLYQNTIVYISLKMFLLNFQIIEILFTDNAYITSSETTYIDGNANRKQRSSFLPSLFQWTGSEIQGRLTHFAV